MSEESWIRSEVKEIIIYVLTFIFMFILLPLGAGFLGQAFEENISGADFNVTSYLGSYLIYIFFGIGALLLIIFPISRLVVGGREDHPATRTNPTWFTMFTVSLIHSPEENGALFRMFEYLGLKGRNNPMRWSLSMFRILIVSILVFGFLGILQISMPQLAVAGVPISQQITPASDVIFSSFVPAFTENGFICLIFFFLLGIDAYVCSKFKLGIGAFFLIGFFLVIPCALIWSGLHSITYKNSEVKLFATFLFSAIGLSLMLLLASFLPFLVWHVCNNAFIRLSNLVPTHSDLIFVCGIIWFIILILYISGEIMVYKYNKRHPIEMPVIPT